MSTHKRIFIGSDMAGDTLHISSCACGRVIKRGMRVRATFERLSHLSEHPSNKQHQAKVYEQADRLDDQRGCCCWGPIC